MRTMKCPECGASLTIKDETREYIFCEYCGSKIDLIDQRIVHTEKIVNESEIEKEKRKTLFAKFTIFLGVIGTMVFLLLLLIDIANQPLARNEMPISGLYAFYVGVFILWYKETKHR